MVEGCVHRMKSLDLKYPRNNKLLENAKRLRKNMTKEERHLWYDFLRRYPIHITRQKIIGNYIADFFCDKANIVIELDGSQHYENDALEYDRKRAKYFENLKIKVLRFSNLDVMQNFEGVCMKINRDICNSIGIHPSVTLKGASSPQVEPLNLS